MKTPQRKWPRLRDFEYGAGQTYFVTICSVQRQKIFSRIKATVSIPPGQPAVLLTPVGQTVYRDLLEISQHHPEVEIWNYAIMPDHIHILLTIHGRTDGEKAVSLPVVIGQYKAGVSRKTGRAIWQRSYYEHVIRNFQDFEETWRYIQNNPMQWILDGKS